MDIARKTAKMQRIRAKIRRMDRGAETGITGDRIAYYVYRGKDAVLYASAAPGYGHFLYEAILIMRETMNDEVLFQAILAYGADADGINDRFCENHALYAMCIHTFLSNTQTEKLREEIHAKAYSDAFETAHALKGVSGNLGLTEYYTLICRLVESLRANKYDGLTDQCAALLEAFYKLKSVVASLAI